MTVTTNARRDWRQSISVSWRLALSLGFIEEAKNGFDCSLVDIVTSEITVAIRHPAAAPRALLEGTIRINVILPFDYGTVVTGLVRNATAPFFIPISDPLQRQAVVEGVVAVLWAASLALGHQDNVGTSLR